MGVGQASINTLHLVTCAGTVHMTQGPIVLIMNQYAYYGKGSIVHSIGQLPHIGLDIDDSDPMLQAMNGYIQSVDHSFQHY